MKHKLIITPNGDIHTLLEDKADFSKLGEVEAKRATHINFDNKRQEHVAVLADTGEEIASGKVRADVIEVEKTVVNNLMAQRAKKGLSPT